MIRMRHNARGHFGIGIYHAKKQVNIGTLMRSAHCFGANFVFTIGRRYDRQSSDTTNATVWVPCYHWLDFDQMLESTPRGSRIVGVEIAESARSLDSYCHPELAVYLLGAEDHGLPPRDLARCHEVVEIPGAARCLNVASAGSIVMYARKAQRLANTQHERRGARCTTA